MAVVDDLAVARSVVERYLEGRLTKVDAITSPWQPIRTAPKDGVAVLVLVEGSDIPRAARWLRGTDDPHATELTAGPGWHLTLDGTPVPEHDGPRYWMHCPDDPDALRRGNEINMTNPADGARSALSAGLGPRWWDCATHGRGRANEWGCPECVREMREEIKRLRAELTKIEAGLCIRKDKRTQRPAGEATMNATTQSGPLEVRLSD